MDYKNENISAINNENKCIVVNEYLLFNYFVCKIWHIW